MMSCKQQKVKAGANSGFRWKNNNTFSCLFLMQDGTFNYLGCYLNYPESLIELNFDFNQLFEERSDEERKYYIRNRML